MMDRLRRRLSWKLFFTYLLVILAGTIVLLATAEVFLPTALNRHMSGMGEMMGGTMGSMMGPVEAPVLDSFRGAFNEAIALAGAAALLVAVVISALVSNRIVAPLRRLERASRRISAGHYDERVEVSQANRPVDELGQLGRQFNAMAAQLEATEARRSELIGNVAHELRTPLTTIKGTLEGLIDGVVPTTPETLHELRRETDRLQRLIRDLQELSRVEGGAVHLDLQSQPVASLLSDAAHRLQRQYDDKGVDLTADVPLESPVVLADADRIGQVLQNLLGNALQHTPSGGKVSVTVRTEGAQAVITVADNGAGIAPADLPRLFERFYRADRSRARASGGSGIGLTIAKHLVEAHGGRIWADSAGAGQGARFGFTLPLGWSTSPR
jgi:two-component system sensor histidine kinase BaeS